MSDSVLSLADKLLIVQKLIEPVVRDAENSGFKRGGSVATYATLEAVLDAVVPALNNQGLVLIQTLTTPPFEGYLALKTTIVDPATGQEVTDTAVVPLDKVSPQGYASAVTYTRRISLVTIMALKTEDDDGNSSSGVAAHAGPKPAGAFPGGGAKNATLPKPKAVDKSEPRQEKAAAPERPKKGLFPTVAVKGKVDTSDQSGDDAEEGGEDNGTD